MPVSLPSGTRHLLPFGKRFRTKLAVVTSTHQMSPESEQVADCTMHSEKPLLKAETPKTLANRINLNPVVFIPDQD